MLERVLEGHDQDIREYLRRHDILKEVICADLGIEGESREPCYAMVGPSTVLITEGLVKALQTLRDVKAHYHEKGRGLGFDAALNAYGLILGTCRTASFLEKARDVLQKEVIRNNSSNQSSANNRFDCRIDLTTPGDVSVLYRAVGKNLVENVFKKRRDGFFERGISYFRELGLAMRDAFAELDPDLVAYFLKQQVSIGSDSFVGLERGRKDVPPGRDDWSRNKGNEEALRELQRLVKTVCMYDPATQENLLFAGQRRKKPIAALLEGRPGTGKTDAVSLAYAYMSRLAQKKDVPCRLVLIDHSFKDAYYSRSQHNLKARLDEAADPSGISMVFIDDVDAVVSDRKNRNNNEADEGILHVLLQALDSSSTDYRGNYLIVMASNYAEKIDLALKNRMTHILSLPGPTKVEDVASVLFDVELQAYADHLSVTPEEKLRLARLCQDILKEDIPITVDGKEYSLAGLEERMCITPRDLVLSGRDLNKIAEEVKGRIQSLDMIDEDVLLLPREGLRETLKMQYQTVCYAVIEQAIKDRALGIVRRKVEKFNEDVRERKRWLKVEEEARKAVHRE